MADFTNHGCKKRNALHKIKSRIQNQKNGGVRKKWTTIGLREKQIGVKSKKLATRARIRKNAR